MIGGKLYAIVFLMGASIAPTLASAQSSVVGASGQSASDIAKSMYTSPGLLIIATGLVVGFATVIAGIYHFKKTADNKLQYPVGEGIAKLIAGCLMLSFTFVYTVLKNSFLTGGDTQWYNGTANNAIAISTVVQASEDYASNSFLDAFLTDEFRAIIFGILWLIGLVFLFTGIYQLKNVTKAEEGAIRNPIIRIIGAIACMNPMLVLCLISSLGPTFLCTEG